VYLTLPVGNKGIVALRNALEEYAQRGGDGPARVEYDGRAYSLDASLPGL
jgi:hypothetical protein